MNPVQLFTLALYLLLFILAVVIFVPVFYSHLYEKKRVLQAKLSAATEIRFTHHQTVSSNDKTSAVPPAIIDRGATIERHTRRSYIEIVNQFDPPPEETPSPKNDWETHWR